MPNPTDCLECSLDPRLRDYAVLEEKRTRAVRLIQVLRWKEGLGPDHPLIVSLVGGTGTGKSTLFNSLAGRTISKTGSKRPCTHRAVILFPQNGAQCAAAWNALPEGAGLDGPASTDFLYRDSMDMQGPILVDTPDFDSVRLSNRPISDLFFVMSDVVVFVTSQEKYADMAGMEMVRKAGAWGKKTIFVLNKGASDDAFAHFCAGCGPDTQVVRVGRLHPTPTLIPGIAAYPTFREVLDSTPGSPVAEDIKQAELDRLRRTTAAAVEALERAATAQVNRIEDVNRRILAKVPAVCEEMEKSLQSPLSTALEVRIRRRLQLLLQKYDLLFDFRMMIREGLTSVRHRLFGTFPLPSRGNSTKDPGWELRHDDLKATWSEVGLQHVEAALDRLNLEISELIAQDPGLADLRAITGTDVAKWGRAEVRQRFDATLAEVTEMLESEFSRFRSGLSAGEKARLCGSYAVWALLLVTADLAMTGGHLTVLNAVVGSAVVPFIPKWALGLHILDMLKGIGLRIERRHRETLRTIIEGQARQYESAFRALVPVPATMERIRRVRDNLTHK